MLTLFLNNYLKLVFMMTPFFVLSAYISMTADMTKKSAQQISIKTTLSVLVSCFSVFFFGKYIFALFGITLDAFRIGAGSVLFLNALAMINTRNDIDTIDDQSDISVVPLAIPITVGPGMIGVLMVMGAEPKTPAELLFFSGALLSAVLTIGIVLMSARLIQQYLSPNGISVLQKITGLFVSAIAAQIIFTGIKGFLF